MTTPLPEGASTPASTPEVRHRARVRLARKWAYLVSANCYLPYAHTEIEQTMLEFVGSIFDAVAADPVDIEAATSVGASLVALNCVNRESLLCTMEVLTTALLHDHEVRRLDRMPVRVAQVLGALTSGVTDAIRQSAVDQQDGMCRTLMKIARRAIQETEAREADLDATSTELSLLQGQLGHQLLHDPLTGLPNRQFCTTRLEQVLMSRRPVTLYRLELDGFALVNDGLGQPIGDRWLAAAAERIHTVVTDRATLIARLDGANFAILQESTPSTTDIALLVRKLNAALAEPAYLDGVGLASTVSVGVVQSPPHRADPDALLHAAGLALRAAKHAGPGKWARNPPDDNERRLLQLAVGMPGAWETGQLAVAYRLRARLADNQPVGVQAFVRWRDEPGADVRHPSLTLAEQAGVTPRLGQWLLHDAGTQLRAWDKESGTELTLAVSLSPHQAAAPDLVQTVLRMLADTGLRPERLQIGMPVAEVCHGREQAVENLTLVADTGARTAVHDFGGGTAELLQLADLSVHEIWLGEPLVHRARRAGDESLTANVMTDLIRLVHRTGAAVGVDNIRDRAEARWWRHAGANTATGLLFSPPDAPTDIAALFT